MERHLVIPDYLVEFRCLGPTCSFNCCHNYWTVEIDTELYAGLHAAMAGAPADRRILEERFPLDDTATPPVYRRTAPPEEAHCPFLQPDCRCRIHADYGEELLPVVCRIFPRYYQSTRQGLLARGTLACPEIARLALTAAAEPVLLRLTAADGPGRHREPSARWRSADEPDPADRASAQILEAIWELLEPGRHPFPFALFVAGVLARQIDAGTPPADAAAAPADPEWLSELRASYDTARLAAHSPLQSAWTTLTALTRFRSASIGHSIRAALNSYPGIERAPAPPAAGAGPAADDEAAGTCGGTTSATMAVLCRRRAAVEAACPGRVAGYWRRFSRHHLFGIAPVDGGKLLEQIMILAHYLAMLDILLHGQPVVQALAGETDDAPADAAAALDQAVTETVARFARITTHNQSLQVRMHDYMHGLGPFGMGGLLTRLYFLETGRTSREGR